MNARDEIKVVVANDLDIRKKISETFKDQAIDEAVQSKILSLVLGERLRCIQTVFGFRWYATHKLEDIAKEIAEGAHEDTRCNRRKNREDCCEGRSGVLSNS